MYLLPLAWCFLPSVLFTAGGHEDEPYPPVPNADSRLTLSAPRRDYLLGEPVILDLTLRNTSKERIQVLEVFVEPRNYDASPWIARMGETFKEFVPQPQITFPPRTTRRILSLAPGGTLNYQYRVAGAPLPKFRLAFPTPGEYRVYVVYPLRVVGAQRNRKIASNTVDVRIKQPDGEDAKVWEQLNNPSFLTLLQIEAVDEGWENEVRKLGELLDKHSKSGYAQALRHFLVKAAPRMHRSLSFDEATRWGAMLGIKGFAWVEDDPGDNRLDAIRNDSFARETTVSTVLKSLSKASGAPLDAPHEIKAKTIRIADSLARVRECMQSLRHFGTWERRGDGYFLVPTQAGAHASKDGKTNQEP